jgi:hypothetical protein
MAMRFLRLKPAPMPTSLRKNVQHDWFPSLSK